MFRPSVPSENCQNRILSGLVLNINSPFYRVNNKELINRPLKNKCYASASLKFHVIQDISHTSNNWELRECVR